MENSFLNALIGSEKVTEKNSPDYIYDTTSDAEVSDTILISLDV